MSLFEELSWKIKPIEDSIDNWIEHLGLAYNHFAVLYSLMSAEVRQVHCTQKDIGEEWYLPKQTVFNICKEYREQGWIEFETNPHDKREKIMRLTDRGRAQAEPVYQASEQLSGRIFARFGKRKSAQLFALLEELSGLCQDEVNKTNSEK